MIATCDIPGPEREGSGDGGPTETDPVLAARQRMDIFIVWLVVGLIAGVLASVVMRGSGLGLLGDVVLGIAGAFVGGWAFRELGWRSPFTGLAGTITVAFVGAVIVLAALRLITGRRARP